MSLMCGWRAASGCMGRLDLFVRSMRTRPISRYMASREFHSRSSLLKTLFWVPVTSGLLELWASDVERKVQPEDARPNATSRVVEDGCVCTEAAFVRVQT